MNSPIKYHGGKGYLAARLAELARGIPHKHRVETHGGGLSFTLACDPEGYSEVVNDMDGELINFWRVLQDASLFTELHRILQVTPVARMEFNAAKANLEHRDERIRAAADLFIRMRQSFGGAGKSWHPLSRRRVRRGMSEQASAWLSAIDGLPEIHDRLKRIVVECDDAASLIRREDTPDTLFYCDPPYMPSTRTSPDVYGYEMTAEQHGDLLCVLLGIKGKFLLSGYDNPMYQEAERRGNWRRIEFDLPNNAAGGDTKRRMTEVVWSNYVA